MPESETPLSDLITRHVAEQSSTSYEQFIRSFLKSDIGVIVQANEDAAALAVPPGTKVVAGNGQLFLRHFSSR